MNYSNYTKTYSEVISNTDNELSGIKMKKVKIAEMYYLKKDCDYDQNLEMELTIHGTTYTGSKIREAFEDTGSHYKVPIAWGISNYGLNGVKDKTSKPKQKWKKIDISWRHNQEEVFNKVVKSLKEKRTALFAAPTGWGKTFTSLTIASQFNTKVIVLVNKLSLVKQWKEAAETLTGLEVGTVQDKNEDWSKPITIATIQTLNSRIDSLPKEFWSAFGMVICDECHVLPCDSFQNVITKFDAYYRMGMSATLRRKDGMDRLWNLHLGDIIARGEKSTSKLKLLLELPKYSGFSDGQFLGYSGEIQHSKALSVIAEDISYNKWLVKKILKILEKGRKLIVTTHRKKQLIILEDMLREYGVDPGIFCAGKHRNKIIKEPDLEEAVTKDVVLATFGKIGLGLDFPQYDTILLATPCADSEQTVGRVGRDENGNDPLVIHPVISTPYCRALFNKCNKQVYKKLDYKRINVLKLFLSLFGF